MIILKTIRETASKAQGVQIVQNKTNKNNSEKNAAKQNAKDKLHCGKNLLPKEFKWNENIPITATSLQKKLQKIRKKRRKKKDWNEMKKKQ